MQIKCSCEKAGLTVVFLAFGLLFSAQLPGLAAVELAGTNTGVVGVFPVIDGDTVAFSSYEDQAGEDLDGDGLISGNPVIRYYSISTGEVTNTRAFGWWPSMDGNIVAFEYQEWYTRVDLNDDGDTQDALVSYYDIADGRLTETRIAGKSPSVDGGIVAFGTFEGDVGVDLNGDGDAEDQVIRYYDTRTGVVTNTEAEGMEASLDCDTIVFFTWEGEEGLDLNDDGDTDDYVVRYYSISTREVTSTGMVGRGPSINVNRIAFTTGESEVGEDLNGDGDTDDQVIRYYDMLTGTGINTMVEGTVACLDRDMILFERYIPELDVEGIGYYDISTGTATLGIVGGGFPSIDGNTIVFSINEGQVDVDLNDEGGKNDRVIFYFVIGQDEPVDLQEEQTGEQTGEQTVGPEWNLLLIAAAVIAVVIFLAILRLRR